MCVDEIKMMMMMTHEIQFLSSLFLALCEFVELGELEQFLSSHDRILYN